MELEMRNDEEDIPQSWTGIRLKWAVIENLSALISSAATKDIVPRLLPGKNLARMPFT